MLTTPEVAQLIGATYRQLDYWARIGALHPTRNGLGSGTHRRWPDQEIRAAAALVSYGAVVNRSGGGGGRVRPEIAEAARTGPEVGWIIVSQDGAIVAQDFDLAARIRQAGAAAVIIELLLLDVLMEPTG